MPSGIYARKPLTIEHKMNLSKAKIGHPNYNIEGKGQFKKGHKGYTFWKGKKLTYNVWMKGKKHLESSKIKMSENAFWKGKHSPAWRGGITSLNKLIRGLPENKKWKQDIFKRDNYICQICKVKDVYLEAHHKNKTFSKILQEFLIKYSILLPISNSYILLKLAKKYDDFWDLNNGITLCEKCHNRTKGRKTWKN